MLLSRLYMYIWCKLQRDIRHLCIWTCLVDLGYARRCVENLVIIRSLEGWSWVQGLMLSVHKAPCSRSSLAGGSSIRSISSPQTNPPRYPYTHTHRKCVTSSHFFPIFFIILKVWHKFWLKLPDVWCWYIFSVYFFVDKNFLFCVICIKILWCRVVQLWLSIFSGMIFCWWVFW